MKGNFGKDIIFMLTKDEILACAGELVIIPELLVFEYMRKGKEGDRKPKSISGIID